MAWAAIELYGLGTAGVITGGESFAFLNGGRASGAI